MQNVGFRYAAVRTAQQYAVGGFVRNLPDGDVECVVEGESDEVAAFLDALAQRMSGYIRTRKEQRAPASGQYHRFDVKY